MNSFLLAIAMHALGPGHDPEAAKLCVRAMELQPKLSPAAACSLAESLVWWAPAGMDPYRSLAIAMQESSLNPAAVGPTGDRGLFQFHRRTADAEGLDWKRLGASPLDVSYQVRSHYQLLAKKLARCPGHSGWACWNSATPKYREAYRHLVNRYYRQPTREK